MKFAILKLMPAFCLCLFLATSCNKTDVKNPAPQNNEQNRERLHTTLTTSDLSARVPADAWWNDEQSATPAAVNAMAARLNPAGYLKFTYLDSALKFTGLDAVLADPNTQYTLFAPNDNAFMNAGFASIGDLLAVGKDALTQILLYHVVSGKVFSTDVPLALNTPAASLQGDTLYLSRKTNPGITHKVSVNGVGVYIADVDLGNGVMHDINRVLMSPAGNIVETAIATPDFSYLVAAVLRASTGSTDVAAVLSGPGPLTVFAPTNQAFMNAGFATIDDINAADPDVLASILTYHVVAARVFSPDVKDGDMPVMLDGNTTLINRVGSIFQRNLEITGNNNPSASTVDKANIVASNGVIHVIDQVLLP